ncbi:MAG: hypothetical protein GC161_00110 [Planctomycetaceae bacterium]|nr:hypothetical protein [Planctomycetaceae bacterium]
MSKTSVLALVLLACGIVPGALSQSLDTALHRLETEEGTFYIVVDPTGSPGPGGAPARLTIHDSNLREIHAIAGHPKSGFFASEPGFFASGGVFPVQRTTQSPPGVMGLCVEQDVPRLTWIPVVGPEKFTPVEFILDLPSEATGPAWLVSVTPVAGSDTPTLHDVVVVGSRWVCSVPIDLANRELANRAAAFQPPGYIAGATVHSPHLHGGSILRVGRYPRVESGGVVALDLHFHDVATLQPRLELWPELRTEELLAAVTIPDVGAPLRGRSLGAFRSIREIFVLGAWFDDTDPLTLWIRLGLHSNGPVEVIGAKTAWSVVFCRITLDAEGKVVRTELPYSTFAQSAHSDMIGWQGVFLEREPEPLEQATWISKFFAREPRIVVMDRSFGALALVDTNNRRHPAHRPADEHIYVSDGEPDSTGLISAARIFLGPEPKLYVARKIPATPPNLFAGILPHGRYARIELEAVVGLEGLRNAHLRDTEEAITSEPPAKKP